MKWSWTADQYCTFCQDILLEELLMPAYLVIGWRISVLPVMDTPADDNFEISPNNLTRRAKYLSMVLNYFWKWRRAEYLLELQNSHSRIRRTTGSSIVAGDDLVLVYDESHPRSHWKMGVVEQILTTRDGQVRGIEVRVQGKRKKTGLRKDHWTCCTPWR